MKRSKLDVGECVSRPLEWMVAPSANLPFASQLFACFNLFWAKPPPNLAELFAETSPRLPALNFRTFRHIFSCGNAYISGKPNSRFTDDYHDSPSLCPLSTRIQYRNLEPVYVYASGFSISAHSVRIDLGVRFSRMMIAPPDYLILI